MLLSTPGAAAGMSVALGPSVPSGARAEGRGEGGFPTGSSRALGPFCREGWGSRVGKCSLSSGASPSSAGRKGKGNPSQWEGQTGVQGMLSTRQTFSPPSGASPFPLQDKQAVLGAVAAMLEVLLHEEQYREHTWEQLLWLLQQYQEVRDNSRLTKVRCCAGPGVAAGVGLREC